MPANASGTGRSVLLVEEYEALSVAIESALKKFAPRHQTYLARSLNEGQRIAHAQGPDLIVLDFDPPQPAAVSFFEEMRSALPNTRALIIAAGVSQELVSERGANGALQFLDKPFELVDFGACIQALLGPWAEEGLSRGTLQNLGLVDAASLLCLAGTDAMIHVHAGEQRNGQLHVQKGHLVHALTDDSEGEAALIQMLHWNQVRFTEAAGIKEIPKTISGPWAATLISALREAKKRQSAAASMSPAAQKRPAISPLKTGFKILLIDDTEMLLIFVEDSLRLADPTFHIATAVTGLHGINEAQRFKPDLIILDYILPDIKGDEVCRRLEASDATRDIPIIMMSGHVHEMTAAAEHLPNVTATIGKPFLSEAMIGLVRGILEEKRIGKEAAVPTQKKTVAPIAEDQTAATGKKEISLSARPIKTEAIGTVRPSRAEGSGEQAVARTLERAKPVVPISPGISDVSEKGDASISVSAVSPLPPPQHAGNIPSLAGNEVLLDLPLDVVSMQFDPSFQIGSIRARPASATVAIEIPALRARTSLPLATGFHLGPIDLDGQGQISVVRLIPTTQPFHVVAAVNAFEIGGMTVVPANEHERLNLLSAATPRMAMQLLAPLELESVEFSATLEVRQLVLRCRSRAVRVTLNSSSSRQGGATFHTTAVTLDAARRITELTLARAG